MDSFEFQPLAGTEEATDPFWSSDSRAVAFIVNAQLRRVGIGGGVQTLGRLESSYTAGGTWNEQGTLVLSNGATPPGATLVRMPADGGRPEPLTTLDQARGELGHYSPRFLPDGRHFAFTVRSTTPQHSGVYLASLAAPHERHRLVGQPSTVWFARDHVLFVRGTTLLAQRFDTPTWQATGEPYPIAEGVDGGPAGTDGLFSASRDGVVVYRPYRGHHTQLAWVGRNGGTLATVGDPQPYAQLALSPDERRVAVELPDDAGHYDIWIIELARGVPTRVTFDPADDRDPVWSPDGTELIFGSRRKGRNTLFRTSLAGRRPEAPLFDTKSDLYPESWTPDGTAIVYLMDRGESRVGWLWALDRHADPQPLVNTGFGVDELQVSPDGQQLAYVSRESGRYEVYVEPFGRVGEKMRISSEGGGQPKWRGDGKELFYLTPNGKLMSAEIRPGRQIGVAKPLFDLGYFDAEVDDYAPSRDGQRFLIKRPLQTVFDVSVYVVLNWETRVK